MTFTESVWDVLTFTNTKTKDDIESYLISIAVFFCFFFVFVLFCHLSISCFHGIFENYLDVYLVLF